MFWGWNVERLKGNECFALPTHLVKQRDTRKVAEWQQDTRETAKRHQRGSKETPERLKRGSKTPERHQRDTREAAERQQDTREILCEVDWGRANLGQSLGLFLDVILELEAETLSESRFLMADLTI